MPIGIYKHQPHTEKTRSKMSETHKRLGIQPPSWKGKKHSKDTKDKIKNSLKGHFVSVETIRKIKEARKRQLNVKSPPHYRGNKNNHWKGGITPLLLQIRNCFESYQWRDDIFYRDNFTCQKCGKKGEKLNAHHVKPFSQIIKEYQIKTVDQALNCAELFNVNNGITLCKNCHDKLSTWWPLRI